MMEEQIMQILQKLDKLDNKIDAMQIKTDTRFDQMQNQIDGMQRQIGGMQKQINGLQGQVGGIQGQINELQNRVEEISDRQLVFESEYGTKIDAIFDAVTMELDKNLEKSEKIRTLEKRADRHDAAMFGHEKRISKLELSR